jgi:hypothetical protein
MGLSRCCRGSPLTPACYTKCLPCGIPNADLSLAITGGLTYISQLFFGGNAIPDVARWSDGNYTLTCTDGEIALTGPGGSWTRTSVTCSPFSASFFFGADSATITGPYEWNPPGTLPCKVPHCGIFCNICGGYTIVSGTANGHDLVPSDPNSGSALVMAYLEYILPVTNPSPPPATIDQPFYYKIVVSCAGSKIYISVFVCWFFFPSIESSPQLFFPIDTSICECDPAVSTGLYNTGGVVPGSGAYWQLVGYCEHTVTDADCSGGYGSSVEFTVPVTWIVFDPLTQRPPWYAPPPFSSVDIKLDLAPSSCCQTFLVKGCNGLPLSDALVDVFDHAGGTLIASGKTDQAGFDNDPNLGKVTLYWPDDCSLERYIEVSHCLFQTYSDTLTFTANGTTDVTLSVAAPAECIPGYAVPEHSVTFTIRDSCTGDPCTGITVIFDATTYYTTDGSGQVILPFPPGPHTLEILDCGSIADYTIKVTIPCDYTDVIAIPCPTCTLTVNVFGCGGLPLPGASVTCGGVGPVLTNASGIATLIEVAAGPQVLAVTCSRFNDYSLSIDLNDCPAAHTYDVNMTIASGYSCLSCGTPIPLAHTTIVAGGIGGTATLTWNATNNDWEGTSTAAFSGNACCPSATFTVFYKFHVNCTMEVSYGTPRHEVGLGYSCPEGSVRIVSLPGVVGGTPTLPTGCDVTPGFYFPFSVAPTPCPGTGDGPWVMFSTTGDSFGMTE